MSDLWSLGYQNYYSRHTDARKHGKIRQSSQKRATVAISIWNGVVVTDKELVNAIRRAPVVNEIASDLIATGRLSPLYDSNVREALNAKPSEVKVPNSVNFLKFLDAIGDISTLAHWMAYNLKRDEVSNAKNRADEIIVLSKKAKKYYSLLTPEEQSFWQNETEKYKEV